MATRNAQELQRVLRCNSQQLEVVAQSVKSWYASGLSYKQFNWPESVHPLALECVCRMFASNQHEQCRPYAERLTREVVDELSKHYVVRFRSVLASDYDQLKPSGTR